MSRFLRFPIKNRKGFTLAEILIVLLIVAILAGMVLPRLLSQGDKAVAAEAVSIIGAIKRAELRYFDERGSWLEFASLCSSQADVEEKLALDLSEVCGTNSKWDYAVEADGDAADSEVVVTATHADEAGDKLILTMAGANSNSWDGAGDYQRDGSKWPNLP